MSKLKVKKFYHRNGRVREENRLVAGQFHQVQRTWHRNGQLAQELRYQHGRLHGVCRQWDENGGLLGTFTMVHGTGLQRYWYDNGQLQLEISSRDGKFHGRTRDWLQDGTLSQEQFYIHSQAVSRAAYLTAARKNPDWPQYAGEPPGKTMCSRVARDRAAFAQFIQSILEKSDHAEARTWLTGETRRHSRSLAKFATTKSALKFVGILYATGAMSVIVAAISADRRKRLYADWLLVQLPPMKFKRAALRKICREFCERRGGAVLPERETGETHLYLMVA
jgi:hypothetical protein